MAEGKVVAVIGASGFLGRHIVGNLLNNGYYVVGFSRRKVEFDSGNYSWHRLDIEDPKAVGSIDFKRFYAVVLNSGLVASSNPARFWAVNAMGTFNVVSHLESMGYEGKFLYISSLAIYGPGEHSHDEEEFSPISEYGKSKLFAERLIRRSRLRWNILRPPVIFGEYDVGLKDIVKLISLGIGLRWNRPKVISVVYAGNVAEAVRCIIESSVDATIFTIKDADFTWEEFSISLSSILGRKIKFWLTLNDFVIKAIFYPGIFLGCILGGSSFFNRDKLKEILADRWVYKSTNVEAIGYSRVFSLEDSISRSLRNWYLLK